MSVSRFVTSAALVLALAPMAHAEDVTVKVSGFSFQGPATPNVGERIGPNNFIVQRGLQLAIYPCMTTFPFCQENTSGFMGRVVTEPERVERIDDGFGNWSFRMYAKQVIAGGDVDFRNDPFFSFLGVQSFPTGIIVADGKFYTNCKISQTLLATGELFHVSPFTGQEVDLEHSGAATVFATWVINRGSTCRSPMGKPVSVSGHGSLIYNPPLISVPSYEGEINLSHE